MISLQPRLVFKLIIQNLKLDLYSENLSVSLFTIADRLHEITLLLIYLLYSAKATTLKGSV